MQGLALRAKLGIDVAVRFSIFRDNLGPAEAECGLGSVERVNARRRDGGGRRRIGRGGSNSPTEDSVLRLDPSGPPLYIHAETIR